MTTTLDARAGHGGAPTGAGPLARLLPGVAALLYAGVQFDGGVIAAAYKGISTVPDDRLNAPFAGALATATSVSWGLSQAVYVVALVGFARSSAVSTSRPGRVGARLAVAGGVAFVLAHVLSLAFRDARVDEAAGLTAITLFLVATLLTAAGFLLAGIAVAKGRRWGSWRRWTPLAVGLTMLVLVPLQFTPLLAVGVALCAATVVAFAVALLVDATGSEA